MNISHRIRSALTMTSLHSPSSSTSSEADDSNLHSPPTTPNPGRGRTLTSASSCSTSSIISLPALRLKKTFTNLRGAKQRRKDERYREALAEWAEADEREWQYPTWGGPAKKSRKFSREQRDLLRSWDWQQSPTRTSLELRTRRSSIFDDNISPCTSRQNSLTGRSSSLQGVYTTAGRHQSVSTASSRERRPCTVCGNE
ncbi:BgTH12-04949 [Blumeria graminis f. sp. triticale]|uniref:BgTH12-04949 n=1 Tax=Blumeria graminis f. sp. triticale TaxID=1689686 RepID=A0A9W4GF13_BLUGR|nr:BgTH12-04949 [Blumeria graminis f. sp. triticale]